MRVHFRVLTRYGFRYSVDLGQTVNVLSKCELIFLAISSQTCTRYGEDDDFPIPAHRLANGIIMLVVLAERLAQILDWFRNVAGYSRFYC